MSRTVGHVAKLNHLDGWPTLMPLVLEKLMIKCHHMWAIKELQIKSKIFLEEACQDDSTSGAELEKERLQ